MKQVLRCAQVSFGILLTATMALTAACNKKMSEKEYWESWVSNYEEDELTEYKIFSREEFQNWVSNLKVDRKIVTIHNHHTWKPDYALFKNNNHRQLIKGMENYHVNHRGWSHIGQHITTFPDGKIGISLSFEEDPYCIAGKNKGGICIENLGNFDKGGDEMTEEQKKTIVFLNASLTKRFNLPVDGNTVIYHTWSASKSCPGTGFFGGNTLADAQKNLYPLVEKVRIELGGEPAPKKIVGLLYAGTSSNRLPNIEVTLSNGETTITNGTGFYSFEVAPGEYTVSASYNGQVKTSPLITLTESSESEVWASLAFPGDSVYSLSGYQLGLNESLAD